MNPGDKTKVQLIEVDPERRRISLSIKRVEGQILPTRIPRGPAGGVRGRRSISTTCPTWP